MKSNKTVAVIGMGNIGKVVTANLAKSNRSFIAADRKMANIPTAIVKADILVLAIPFDAIRGFIAENKEALVGKIIVDPSNPIAPDQKGGFAKVIGKDESAGQINAAALPAGAKFAKALGTLAATSLAGAAFRTPEPAVLFYATDDRSIDAEIEQLIRDVGFDAVRVGGLNQSVRIEVFGDLHEFGAIGRPVSTEEARQKI